MDIVEQLRERSKNLSDFGPDAYEDADLDYKAANEIEQLREALRKIEDSRKAVQPYTDEIERLRLGNRLHLELAEIKEAEIKHLQYELNELRLSYDVVLDALRNK